MTGLDAFFSFLSTLRRCWNCSPSRCLVSPVCIYIYIYFFFFSFYLNEIMSQSVAQSVNYSAGQLAIQPVNQSVS